MTADPEWLEWRFLGSMTNSIGANRGKLRTKTQLLSGAFTLITGAAVLGGYLVVHTITAGA